MSEIERNASGQGYFPVPRWMRNYLDKEPVNFSFCFPRIVSWKEKDEKITSDKDAHKKLCDKSRKCYAAEGVKTSLERICQSQEETLKYFEGKKLVIFRKRAELTSPFITGLGSGHPTETGMILDRNTGLPYIPASSIKGVLRIAFALNLARERNSNGSEDVEIDAECDKYFGTENTKAKEQNRGMICFLDAYPETVPELQVDIMNPHFSSYYGGKGKVLPVETESPIPIQFLTVSKGVRFKFNCFLLNPIEDAEEAKLLKQKLNKAFQTALKEIGFGAKTAIGYGRFRPL